MDRELCIEIAKGVMAALVGPGSWKEHFGEPWIVSDALPGLSAGDVVYEFDYDDGKIVEREVCYAVNGVGYLSAFDGSGRPYLSPCRSDFVWKSFAEAVEANRYDIEEELPLAKDRYESLRGLKHVLDG